MKTKMSQFCNIASRTITTKTELIPVTIQKNKDEGYMIIEANKAPYQQNKKYDEKLANDYLTLKAAVDAYHRYLIENSMTSFLKMADNGSVGKAGNKQTKAGFLKFLYDAIASNEELNKDNCKSLLSFVTMVLKENTECFFDPSFVHKNLQEAKFLKGSKNNQSELLSFLHSSICAEYFYENEQHRNAAVAILSSYDSKIFSNCKGLLEARMKMYESEGKSTSVPYRCIVHNLPRFKKSKSIFETALSIGSIFDIDQLNKDFSEELVTLSSLAGINVLSVEKLFDKELYPCYMTQRGLTLLNTIIGKKSDKHTDTKGLNQYINEYNQKIKNCNKRKTEIRSFAPMDQLHDLILFGNEDFITQLQDYSEVKPIVRDIVKDLNRIGALNGRTEKNKVFVLLSSLSSFHMDRVFISSRSLSTISQTLWKEWGILRDSVNRDKNGKILQKFISIESLNQYIERQKLEDNHTIQEFFISCMVNSVDKNDSKEELFGMLKRHFEKVQEARILQYKQLNSEQQNILKLFLDSVIELRRFMSVLAIGLHQNDADGLFYEEFEKYWSVLNDFTDDYDLINNLFNRKPFNTDKIRLHFGVGEELLHGWPEQENENKRTYGKSYLFREKHQNDDEYDYYLGISTSNKLFSGLNLDLNKKRRELHDSNDLCSLERFYYYQMSSKTFSGQNYKNANGVYLEEADAELVHYLTTAILNQGSSELRNQYNILAKSSRDEDVKDSRKQSVLMSLIENSEEDKDLMASILADSKFIQYYRDMLSRWKNAFARAKRVPYAQQCSKDENKYTSFNQVKEDIDIVGSCRTIEYIPVSWKELSQSVLSKELYLFRISNKDLSYARTMSDGKRESRGNENLHTMYLRAMMDPTQETFDIGTGDVFFREATKGLKYNVNNPTHPKDEEIGCKSAEKKGETRKMKCDLIKDKHYTQDKYLFHLSMTQNYKAEPIVGGLNKAVCEYLAYNGTDKEVNHIIGIDRGERNLLYITMIDMEGKIILQKSLNTIVSEGVSSKGEKYVSRVDYHALLKEKEAEMKKAQKTWGVTAKIADIKRGYISLAVHEIVKLMVENKAIIVMEDLNNGFFGTRQSVLANVYQEFENELERKLQFCVVDKKLAYNEPGGLYNALQLAGMRDANSKSKQNGFIFYVPAWMTSKVDPITGFVNLFTFNYKNEESSRAFFKAFRSIKKNTQTGEYEFVFRYNDFDKLKVLQHVVIPDVEWTLTTYGSRIVRLQTENGYDYESVLDLTKQFDEAFYTHDIDVNGNIKEQIVQQGTSPLFKELFKWLKIVLQMRNSDDKGNDFIISPVKCNENGDHYDSRIIKEIKENNEANGIDSQILEPIDADANGAYNIARKGLMAVRQIKAGASSFKIDKASWLKEAQKNLLSVS